MLTFAAARHVSRAVDRREVGRDARACAELLVNEEVSVVRTVVQVLDALADGNFRRVAREVADGRRHLVEEQLSWPPDRDPLADDVPVIVVGRDLRRLSLDDVHAPVLPLDACDGLGGEEHVPEPRAALPVAQSNARIVPSTGESRAREEPEIQRVSSRSVELDPRAQGFAMLNLVRRDQSLRWCR